MAKAGAGGASTSSDECKEYRVKMADIGSKKLNIMRFKPPHTCDMSKIINPILERQQVTGEEVMPEYGEGSEFGRKMKEEARKKRKGIRIKKAHPDDQPWVLKEQKKGGKHFVGRKEGGVNRSTSYYLFIPKADGTCEAFPVTNWYDFVPPVQYNFLNDEEAEERFEKRNKTLNYFSIMVSKRIREKEGKEMEEAEEKTKSGKKKGNLQLVESDSDEFSSVGSDRDDDDNDKPLASKKRKRTLSATAKRKGPKQKRAEHSGSEAGEDTDEGEMESREMDYYSDTSSDSEEEKVKQAVKDEPRDDAEVERKEEEPIDHVFEESSSDDENEDLTESGKELRALINKQTESTAEADDEDEEQKSPEKQPSWSAVTTAGKTSSTTVPAQQQSSSSSSSSHKHAGTKRVAESQPESSSSPAAKRSKADVSTITAHEVRKYLQRRPMMPKQLVKKFVKLKTGMDKQQVVSELGQLLRNMADVDKSKVMGKMHLSLKTDTSTSS